MNIVSSVMCFKYVALAILQKKKKKINYIYMQNDFTSMQSSMKNQTSWNNNKIIV